jgi:hypothetical protein
MAFPQEKISPFLGQLHLVILLSFRAPIDKHPQRAVDIGTGTGKYLLNR